MAMWTTFGDYLEASGWTTALNQAGIASSGTADSFLKASHLTRTTHAHQLSVLALSMLQHDAFMQTEGPHDESNKETWRQAMVAKSPTFQYWDTIIKMEILGLIFVRAHREMNFPLYVESLKALVPWFFVLDTRIMPDGFPFTSMTWKVFPHQSVKNFKNMGTGLSRKLQISSPPCQSIRLTSKTMR